MMRNRWKKGVVALSAIAAMTMTAPTVSADTLEFGNGISLSQGDVNDENIEQEVRSALDDANHDWGGNEQEAIDNFTSYYSDELGALSNNQSLSEAEEENLQHKNLEFNEYVQGNNDDLMTPSGENFSEARSADLLRTEIIASPGFFTSGFYRDMGTCEAMIDEVDEHRDNTDMEGMERDGDEIHDHMDDGMNDGDKGVDALTTAVQNIGSSGTDEDGESGLIASNCNPLGFIQNLIKIYDPVNITNSEVVMSLIYSFQIVAMGVAALLIASFAMYYAAGNATTDPVKFLLRGFIIFMVVLNFPYFIQDILTINNMIVFYIATDVGFHTGTAMFGAGMIAFISAVITMIASYGAIMLLTPGGLGLVLGIFFLLILFFLAKAVFTLVFWWYARLLMLFFLAIIGPLFMIMMILPKTASYGTKWIQFFLGETFTQAFMVIGFYILGELFRFPTIMQLGDTHNFGFIGHLLLMYAALTLLTKLPDLSKKIIGSDFGGVGWNDAKRAGSNVGQFVNAGGNAALNRMQTSRANKLDTKTNELRQDSKKATMQGDHQKAEQFNRLANETEDKKKKAQKLNDSKGLGNLAGAANYKKADLSDRNLAATYSKQKAKEEREEEVHEAGAQYQRDIQDIENNDSLSDEERQDEMKRAEERLTDSIREAHDKEKPQNADRMKNAEKTSDDVDAAMALARKNMKGLNDVERAASPYSLDKQGRREAQRYFDKAKGSSEGKSEAIDRLSESIQESNPEMSEEDARTTAIDMIGKRSEMHAQEWLKNNGNKDEKKKANEALGNLQKNFADEYGENGEELGENVQSRLEKEDGRIKDDTVGVMAGEDYLMRETNLDKKDAHQLAKNLRNGAAMKEMKETRKPTRKALAGMMEKGSMKDMVKQKQNELQALGMSEKEAGQQAEPFVRNELEQAASASDDSLTHMSYMDDLVNEKNLNTKDMDAVEKLGKTTGDFAEEREEAVQEMKSSLLAHNPDMTEHEADTLTQRAIGDQTTFNDKKREFETKQKQADERTKMRNYRHDLQSNVQNMEKAETFKADKTGNSANQVMGTHKGNLGTEKGREKAKQAVGQALIANVPELDEGVAYKEANRMVSAHASLNEVDKELAKPSFAEPRREKLQSELETKEASYDQTLKQETFQAARSAQEVFDNQQTGLNQPEEREIVEAQLAQTLQTNNPDMPKEEVQSQVKEVVQAQNEVNELSRKMEEPNIPEEQKNNLVQQHGSAKTKLNETLQGEAFQAKSAGASAGAILKQHAQTSGLSNESSQQQAVTQVANALQANNDNIGQKQALEMAENVVEVKADAMGAEQSLNQTEAKFEQETVDVSKSQMEEAQKEVDQTVGGEFFTNTQTGVEQPTAAQAMETAAPKVEQTQNSMVQAKEQFTEQVEPQHPGLANEVQAGAIAEKTMTGPETAVQAANVGEEKTIEKAQEKMSGYGLDETTAQQAAESRYTEVKEAVTGTQRGFKFDGVSEEEAKDTSEPGFFDRIDADTTPKDKPPKSSDKGPKVKNRKEEKMAQNEKDSHKKSKKEEGNEPPK